MSTELMIANFSEAQAAIRHVRDEVFVREQGIDAREEYDDHDGHCTHVVIIVAGIPVATGRLDVKQQGRLGRIAVLANYRGRRLGERVVGELERLALAAGLTQCWFHAQVAAIGFYERLGYRSEGSEFIEANIPHIRMSKRIVATAASELE